MPVVTIRGQMGSKAEDVAKLAAHDLQADYVDREIIAQVASRLHRQKEDVEAKEMPPATLLGRIEEALSVTGAYGTMDAMTAIYVPGWQIPLNDEDYVEALQAVVKKLASGGSLVMWGQGSQFILEDHPGTLHVLVVAPLVARLKRVMESLGIDEESAKQEIANFDDSRREFARRYFKADLEDPIHYDLIINTGGITVREASAIITHACETCEKARETKKEQSESSATV